VPHHERESTIIWRIASAAETAATALRLAILCPIASRGAFQFRDARSGISQSSGRAG
jgi:hypothetical protein